MFLFDRLLKRVIRKGTLHVIDASGKKHSYGGEPGPEVTIQITDASLYRKLFTNPELHMGEAYMDGTLLVREGGIRGFLTLSALNRQSVRNHPLQKLLRGTMKKLKRWQQRNTQKASSANVRHHYDLSNDF